MESFLDEYLKGSAGAESSGLPPEGSGTHYPSLWTSALAQFYIPGTTEGVGVDL